jgi:hypothetical protein
MTARHDPILLCRPDHAAAHLRWLIRPATYAEHSLLLVTAGSDGRPVHHIEVVDCSPDPSPGDCATVLNNLVTALCTAPDGSWPHGLLLGLTRPGTDTVQQVDRVWFRALHRVCHARGVTALGCYIVGPHGARPVQIDDAA